MTALARSEAPGASRASDVSPRASGSSPAAAGVTPQAPAAAPAQATCVVCHGPIGPTSVGVYGHARNPGADHHYARPERTEEDAMKGTTSTVRYKGRSVTVTDGDLEEAGDLIGEAVRDALAPFGDFVPSEEVAAVAGGLIATNGLFGRLTRHRIAYLLDRRPTTGSPKSGVHGLAEVKLTPKVWRDLARVDAAIVVRRSAWDALTDRQREALVHHELMHLDENDKGALVIRDHDLEEFGATVRTYGQWLPDVAFFAEQLRLFESAAA